MNTAQEATSGPLINIKFLVVISMLCKTQWLWELQTRSHKTNLLDILSTSPHYSLGNEHWQQMRIQMLILGSKGLKQDFFIKASHLSSSGFLELEIGYYMYTLHGSQGGVLGISSNRDDRRIFLGLKFSIPGFFWARKFGKYFFG